MIKFKVKINLLFITDWYILKRETGKLKRWSYNGAWFSWGIWLYLIHSSSISRRIPEMVLLLHVTQWWLWCSHLACGTISPSVKWEQHSLMGMTAAFLWKPHILKTCILEIIFFWMRWVGKKSESPVSNLQLFSHKSLNHKGVFPNSYWDYFVMAPQNSNLIN